MASNLIAMASNLRAMASNLTALVQTMGADCILTMRLEFRSSKVCIEGVSTSLSLALL